MRQAQDELVRMRCARGGDDLLARRLGLAVGDVLGDGAEEEEGLLQHEADVAPVFGEGQRPEVDTVDPDRAFGGVVEAADQVHQRALARTRVADETDHLAGADVEVDVAQHGAVAVAEADLAHLDVAGEGLRQRHRVGRLGDAGDMVEDVEDALGAGGGLLRHRDDAAHRVEPRVEAADVGDEGREHADGDRALRHLPDAEGPDDQEADLGRQRHRRREHRPDLVHAVVHRQVARVGFLEARHLALLLREGLDHPDAGNGVGEHAGHFGPDPVDLLEAVAQPVAHVVDQPADERQRRQRHQRQPRVDREQDHGGHRDHQHVGGEVEQVEREEDADAVALGADARHQVARALATEVFERQGLQVLVGGRAQVGADALADQRQDVGLRPAERPGDQRRHEQAAEQHVDLGGVDRRPVLERDQHLVHQRHGQVGRHQRRRGRGQHQQEAGEQLALVRFGEAPQAEQRPGGGRLVDLAAALRTVVLSGRQRVLAVRTDCPLRRLRLQPAQARRQPATELLDQAAGSGVLGQRVAPEPEQAA